MALEKRSPRKAYALYIDAAFSADYSETDYKIIGHDTDNLSINLSPNVTPSENVIGETTVIHSGYSPSADISSFYHRMKGVLEDKILKLAMGRKSGDACKTSCVEAAWEMPEDENTEPTLICAYREDILCIPTSYGGDVSGFQTPFQVNFAGNRKEGTFDRGTLKFTEKNAQAL